MTYFQKPNTSAYITFIAFLVSFAHVHVLKEAALVIFVVAGSYWSYQEVFHGANRFRKWLGIVGFIGVIGYLVIFILL